MMTKKSAFILAGKILSKLATWFKLMTESGLTLKDIQRSINDSKMRNALVAFWKNYGFEATTSQKSAREIMGKNFFGVEEAIKYFGANPTSQQCSVLSEIPFSETVLQECKDTHILIAVFPISILDIRGKVQDGLFFNQDWYDKQSFAKERGECQWQLIRKTLVDNSISKNWQEQQLLLTKDEKVPSAQMMVYTIIGHYLNTGERLFEKVYVRTSSVDSGGNHVRVGDFDFINGLRVYDYCNDYRRDDIGVSSARE